MKSLANAGVLAIAFISSWAEPSSAAVVRTVTELETSGALFTVVQRVPCGDGSSAEVETSIALSGFAETVSGTEGDSSSTELNIILAEFNACTQRFMRVQRVVEDEAYVQVGVDTVLIDGAFDLIDSTGPVGVIDIDIEISGIGRATRDNSTSQTNAGDTRIITISQQSTRAGAVDGTITLRGVEFVPSLRSAELTSSRTTELRITP